jgi:hypothetical protein
LARAAVVVAGALQEQLVVAIQVARVDLFLVQVQMVEILDLAVVVEMPVKELVEMVQLELLFCATHLLTTVFLRRLQVVLRRTQFQMLAVVLGRFHLELHHSKFY